MLDAAHAGVGAGPIGSPIVRPDDGAELEHMTRKESERGREGPVERAIDRWVDQGLMDADLAGRLREDARQVRSERRRRFSQFVVAATGGIVTVIAAAVLFTWAWPHLGAGGRSAVMGGVGGALALLGLRVEGSPTRAPAGYGLQTAGLLLVLAAFAYSERAWDNGTPGAVVAGLAALVLPLVMAPLAVRRNAVMPAVLTVLGYAFLFVFLVRVVDLDEELALWVLDGVLLGSVLVLGLRVARWTASVAGTEDVRPGWELGAFTASIQAAPILIFATATGPLRLREGAVFPLDAWWVLMTGLTLWAVHAAPPALRRPWIPRQLAWSVLAGIILGFWTVLEGLDGPSWAAALVVGGLGAATLWHALSFGVRETVAWGCVALIAAAWYYGAEAGGAPGAAAALAFTAALLFWISGRLGVRGGDGAPAT